MPYDNPSVYKSVKLFAKIFRTMICVATDIGTELRLFRQKLRLTQEEMARRIGASRAQYANWEVGTAKPPYLFLVRLDELGFAVPDPGFVRESQAAYRVRATRGQLMFMIDTLYNCEVPAELRSNARQELIAALGIESSDEN